MQGKYYLKITKNTFFLESSPPFKFDYDLPKPGTKWIFLQNLPTCRNICSIKLTKENKKLLVFDFLKMGLCKHFKNSTITNGGRFFITYLLLLGWSAEGLLVHSADIFFEDSGKFPLNSPFFAFNLLNF